jgi:hypothetical protein
MGSIVTTIVLKNQGKDGRLTGNIIDTLLENVVI